MILLGIFLIGYAIGLFIGNLYWKPKNSAKEKDIEEKNENDKR